jgi:hypothetical protein
MPDWDEEYRKNNRCTCYGGSICGGNKRHAEMILKRDGHCPKHKKYK